MSFFDLGDDAEALPTPAELKERLPLTPAAALTVRDERRAVRRILGRKDPRLLVVVGPCSIHDPDATLEYARKLRVLSGEVSETMMLIMRAYFEKPRTTVGWKGFLCDPRLDGSHHMEEGLAAARRLLIQIAELGMPVATEILSMVTPHYLGDLISWAAVGARTTEAQIYRELASALTMPVGFKNGTDGSIKVAVQAIEAASAAHHFVGNDPLSGRPAVLRSRGNKYAHVVLRGGSGGPNYDEESIRRTEESLEKAGLRCPIVVDCSHGNSRKNHQLQAVAMTECVRQLAQGNMSLAGVMLESNLLPGNQPLNCPATELRRGVSITDACLGWDETADLIRESHTRLKEVFPARAERIRPLSVFAPPSRIGERA